MAAAKEGTLMPFAWTPYQKLPAAPELTTSSYPPGTQALAPLRSSRRERLAVWIRHFFLLVRNVAREILRTERQEIIDPSRLKIDLTRLDRRRAKLECLRIYHRHPALLVAGGGILTALWMKGSSSQDRARIRRRRLGSTL
jgi:hypothetical protein